MTDYVLIGGGALAREIVDWFTPSLKASGSRFVGYLDDGEAPMKAFGFDLPQLGDTQFLEFGSALPVMAVGEPAGKRMLAERYAGRPFAAALVHPTAVVSASARLGQGVVVGPLALVSANAVVEDHVLVNAYASVGHDVRVGACTTLSCHVDLTGGVSVGRESFFGSGARVIPNIGVGDRCSIGAGAVVVRRTGDDATLFAAPARRL
jgi:sugar O-acyltransferase (sialic acid O-acetyltransferase NeuD family)